MIDGVTTTSSVSWFTDTTEGTDPINALPISTVDPNTLIDLNVAVFSSESRIAAAAVCTTYTTDVAVRPIEVIGTEYREIESNLGYAISSIVECRTHFLFYGDVASNCNGEHINQIIQLS